jgi:hypothetical protein
MDADQRALSVGEVRVQGTLAGLSANVFAIFSE